MIALVAALALGLAAQVVVANNLHRPRFCTCTQCEPGKEPAGCKGGRNVHGYPEAQVDVNTDESVALREIKQWFYATNEALSDDPCEVAAVYAVRRNAHLETDDMHHRYSSECRSAQFCGGMPAPSRKLAARSTYEPAVGAYVRWTGHYWVPTTFAGNNVSSLSSWADDMCPHTAADAAAWVANYDHFATDEDRWSCICGAFEWATQGAGAVKAPSQWAQDLPKDVFPFISYPEDECYCPPRSRYVHSSQTMMWPAHGPHSFVLGVQACLENLVRDYVINALIDKHPYPWTSDNSGIQEADDLKWEKVQTVNCTAILSRPSAASGDAAGAAAGDGPRTLATDMTTTGDDDGRVPKYCSDGCDTHRCRNDDPAQ